MDLARLAVIREAGGEESGAKAVEIVEATGRRLMEMKDGNPEIKLPGSHRGPSLDVLTNVLGVEDLRAKNNGLHGASIDSQQTARVVEGMRRLRGVMPE